MLTILQAGFCTRRNICTHILHFTKRNVKSAWRSTALEHFNFPLFTLIDAGKTIIMQKKAIKASIRTNPHSLFVKQRFIHLKLISALSPLMVPLRIAIRKRVWGINYVLVPFNKCRNFIDD